VVVVVVVVERDAGDGDSHRFQPRGEFSWASAVTTHAGSSLKSTTRSQRRGSMCRR
jgi:hypothetical protein